jgi:hypothetical protein
MMTVEVQRCNSRIPDGDARRGSVGCPPAATAVIQCDATGAAATLDTPATDSSASGDRRRAAVTSSEVADTPLGMQRR